jgi:ubiquinone/menaquinone biosynthesis C-methylase UbiE
MTEFDGYSQGYEQDINAAISHTGKPQEFFTRVKADYLSELFARNFGANSKDEILDVGCGNGSIHPMLLDRHPGLRLTGIDVASTFLETATRQHPQVRYDVYDGVKLPYPTARFDAAYTICVMHHVAPTEWSSFLSEMSRVVRPGGLVSVIEHNPLNPLTRRLVNTCPFDKNAVLLRSSRLTKLMVDAGLREVACRFIQFTPFDGAFFKFFDRMMGWLPLGAQYLATGRVAPGTGH